MEIGIRKLFTGLGVAGVGWVVVPENVEREDYIRDCYRTNTITLNAGEGTGYYTGVRVDTDVMQRITFPVDETNRGTPVVWVRDNLSQLPVVVAVLRTKGEYYPLEEGQWRMKRETSAGVVEMWIDANRPQFNIQINSIDPEIPSRVSVSVTSPRGDSRLSVAVDGEVRVIGGKKITAEGGEEVRVSVFDPETGDVKGSAWYKRGEGFRYEDEFDNKVTIEDGKMTIESPTINHNGGAEPMVLGDTLATLLDDILSAIQSITVVTPQGTSGTPVNSPQFAAIQARLENIKSQHSNLD